MRKFAFNLEKVLSLRKYRERETEIELGRAVGILVGIEQNIHSVTEERFRSGEHYSGNSAMLRSYLLYADRLDREKEQLIVEATKAEEKVEEARGIYIEASRDRKILDKLKEKQEVEYRKFILNEEVKISDDQAAGRAASFKNGSPALP